MDDVHPESAPTIAARMPSYMTTIESINQQDCPEESIFFCPFIPVYLSILALSGKAKLRLWSVWLTCVHVSCMKFGTATSLLAGPVVLLVPKSPKRIQCPQVWPILPHRTRNLCLRCSSLVQSSQTRGPPTWVAPAAARRKIHQHWAQRVLQEAACATESTAMHRPNISHLEEKQSIHPAWSKIGQIAFLRRCAREMQQCDPWTLPPV